MLILTYTLISLICTAFLFVKLIINLLKQKKKKFHFYRTLSDLIGRFVEDVKASGFPRMTGEDSNNLHTSSADLFIFYKNCMSQCLQLFTNTDLLCKLTTTFQKYLREYSNRVLSSSLPKYDFFIQEK